MSGAEILALVTSIMTVITFASQTAQICKNIYDGKPAADKDAYRRASSMMDATTTMKAHCATFLSSSPDERSLADIVHKCHVVATDLQREVASIQVIGAQGNILKTIKGTSKSIRGKSNVEKLEKTLREYENTMQTHLLVHLRTRLDAAKLQRDEHFNIWSDGLKGVISQLATGSQQVFETVKSEGCATRGFAQERHRHTENAINQRITTEREYAITEGQRRRLLRSLKYSGMNERRSVIKDSHEETFHWVLKRPSEIQEPEATTVLNKWGKRNYSSLDNSFESCASHQWQKRWPNFIEWLESDETKYWISGKPGSGKSTLVKFLIENPKTATALNQWRDGTEILSHFFWKLGGPAQQNLRGFWFSLAHQRLLNNPNILQNILSNSVTARTKDEPSDWSDKELRAICLEILGQGSQPLCIFLDGLDEIADSDGSSKVIGAIDDIIKTLAPNIKTCFSCRLENRFKIRLAGVPELKIHDLTRRDMWWMIRSEISRFCSSLPVHTEQVEVLREKIEAALIEKAAGVFIWLVLALKTLQPGFENGDSESELLSRVEGLPSGIENLYEDMWSRLGVSESTYKEKGSEYLNLMVISMKLRDDYPNMEKDARKPLLLGQIAIAADPVLRTRFNSTSGDFGRSILLQECKKTQQAIENRTSGLLEVMDNSDTGRVYGIPGDVPGKHVTFIHRTAYDYLTTTSHGSEILATSPVSPCHTHIHLACGILGLDPFIGNFPDFNLRQALFHLDQAASYGSESSLQSKVLSYCFKLCTEKVEGDKERFNPDGGRVITARLFNGPLATTTFISTILEFRCCEPWFTQIAQERDRTPDFLSSLLYEFLMRVGEKIQDIDSSNANAQTLDALDSKVRHCCRTIQWLISLGASVHFVDESITTMSTLNTWLAKFASFSIHFLSVKHVNHVKYGWNLGILASLIKATEEPASTILIQGQFFKDHHPMLEASFCRLDDNPYCLNDHEHMPKPGKHVNLCDALPIKFDIKVSLGFCVSIFLGFEMENMESNVSELNILREFCNQVSKETLETPESVCVTVHEDFSSSQAGFCVLRNPHLDRPARAAWFWGRLEWLILLSYTGYPRNMSIAQEDQDAFIRGLKKLQENDAL